MLILSEGFFLVKNLPTFNLLVQLTSLRLIRNLMTELQKQNKNIVCRKFKYILNISIIFLVCEGLVKKTSVQSKSVRSNCGSKIILFRARLHISFLASRDVDTLLWV